MSLPPPPPAWMHKPRSKLSQDEQGGDGGKVITTSAAGFGVFGGLRAIGADAWQRRYVFMDERGAGGGGGGLGLSSSPSPLPSSNVFLCYGKGPTKVDKSVPLSSVRAVDVLTPAQMLDLRAPASLAHYGWQMSDGGKEITWACEDAETRDTWIRFLRSEIKKNSNVVGRPRSPRGGGPLVADREEGGPQKNTIKGPSDKNNNRSFAAASPTSSSSQAPSLLGSPRDQLSATAPSARGLGLAGKLQLQNFGSIASNGISDIVSKLGAGVRAVGRAASPVAVFGGGGGYTNRANKSFGGDPQGKPLLSNCRIEVMPSSSSPSAAAVGESFTNNLSMTSASHRNAAMMLQQSFAGGPSNTRNSVMFHLYLVRKSDCAVLKVTERSWDDALGFTRMIRSIAPKMELPAQPKVGGGKESEGTLESQRASYIATLRLFGPEARKLVLEWAATALPARFASTAPRSLRSNMSPLKPAFV